MTDNIENIFFQSIDKTRDQTTKCAFSVLEYVSDERLKSKYLSDLEKVLVSCVKSEHAAALSRKAAKEAEERAVNEETGHPDVVKYEEAYQENLEELQQDSNLQEIIDNAPSVKAFREQLMVQIVPEIDTRDEELEATKETLNLIDPISKKPMTDPVRNKQCGHVYDRPSVVNMIKVNKRKGFRCPTMGCGNRVPLTVADLEDALDVRRQILLHQTEK